MSKKYNKSVIFMPNARFAGQNIKKIKKNIVSALKNKVNSAYFFGSAARNEGDYYSDIDLIIVKDTDKPFSQRAFDFLDLLDIYHAIDILVYSPKEFEALTSNPTAGFWENVVNDLEQVI